MEKSKKDIITSCIQKLCEKHIFRLYEYSQIRNESNIIPFYEEINKMHADLQVDSYTIYDGINTTTTLGTTIKFTAKDNNHKVKVTIYEETKT